MTSFIVYALLALTCAWNLLRVARKVNRTSILAIIFLTPISLLPLFSIIVLLSVDGQERNKMKVDTLNRLMDDKSDQEVQGNVGAGENMRY